jgi:hypothetical protein
MGEQFGKRKLIKDISANTLQIAIIQFFSLAVFYFTSRFLPKNDLINEIDKKINSAVDKRLVADVPIGLHHGGVDGLPHLGAGGQQQSADGLVQVGWRGFRQHGVGSEIQAC